MNPSPGRGQSGRGQMGRGQSGGRGQSTRGQTSQTGRGGQQTAGQTVREALQQMRNAQLGRGQSGPGRPARQPLQPIRAPQGRGRVSAGRPPGRGQAAPSLLLRGQLARGFPGIRRAFTRRLVPQREEPTHVYFTSPRHPPGTPAPPIGVTPDFGGGPPPARTNYKLHVEFRAHEKTITAVRWSPCGTYLGTSSNDKMIKFWKMPNAAQDRVLIGHSSGINDFAWSHDSSQIASVSDDGTVRVYDFLPGKCSRVLRGHTMYVFCVTFNPQGTFIASGSFDETIRIWDNHNGHCIKILKGHSDPITGLSFNRDGSLLASGSYDGRVQIWDMSTSKPIKTFIDEENPPVTFVRFSPNGKYVLVSNLNNAVKLWEVSKGKCLKDYVGHENYKFAIASNFSVTGGKWIVSGSEDHRIYIWSLQTREVIQLMEAHTAAVHTLDCHPNRNIIASAAIDPDYKVRIWYSDY